MRKILAELSQRNVFRVAALYGVAAWMGLSVADIVIGLLDLPDGALRVVFYILLLGLPVVLVLSWLYELTPEGIKREIEIQPGDSIKKKTGHRLNILIGFGVLLVLGGMALQYFFFPGSGSGNVEAPPNSVAVLPFADMSPEGDQEYFADGISEELLNLLAKIPELRVAARTSAFAFKGKNEDMTSIARQLRVANVLEGSIRKDGDNIRITAQLIEAETGYHLFSETYDRALVSIFQLQDEISAEVVKQLKVHLLDEIPNAEVTDVEAYDLYLQALHHGYKGSVEDMRMSIELLKRTVDIDPDFVAGWNALARGYTNLASFDLQYKEEAIPQAEAAAKRALSLEPNNPQTLSVLGWLARLQGEKPGMRYDQGLAEAAIYFQKAIDLAPQDTQILTSAVVILQDLGRLDEVIRLRLRLRELDPLNNSNDLALGIAYYMNRDFEQAAASYDDVLKLSPGDVLTRWWRSYLDCIEQRFESCLQTYEELAEESGNVGFQLEGRALAYPGMGRAAEGAAALTELADEHASEWGEPYVAAVYAFRGDADQAFYWLEKAFEEGGDLVYVPYDPLFDPIRNDPRFAPFLEKAGLSPEQLGAIEFEIILPE